VYFSDADPVFALAEHQKDPSSSVRIGNRRLPTHINKSRQIPATTTAFVPLLYGDLTTVCSARQVRRARLVTEDLNALKASLRCSRRCRRVCSPKNSCGTSPNTTTDRTAQPPRAAAHLDARLASASRAGIGVFFDLDRLKAINDYLGHTAATGSSAFSPHGCVKAPRART